MWQTHRQTHRHTTTAYTALSKALQSKKRSIGCEDIKIFRFFKMAAAAILDFRNREFLFAYGIWGPRCITVPNFVKIGRSIEEILRFFEFSRWPPPPSWICLGHIWTTHSEYLRVSITLQNLVIVYAVVFIIWTFQYLARLAGQCLFTPEKLGVFGQFDPLNGLQYQPKPKTAHPCVSPHHMSD